MKAVDFFQVSKQHVIHVAQFHGNDVIKCRILHRLQIAVDNRFQFTDVRSFSLYQLADHVTAICGQRNQVKVIGNR